MTKQYDQCHFTGSPAAPKSVLPGAGKLLPPLTDFRTVGRSSLISPRIFRAALRAVEFAIILLTGFIAASIHIGFSQVTSSIGYALALAGTAAATVIFCDMLGAYRRQQIASLLEASPRVLFGWTAAVGLLTAAVFFMKIGPDFSRVWLAAWYISTLIVLLMNRSIAASTMHRWAQQGRLNRRAVIIGSGNDCLELIRKLENDKSSDLRLCGFFDDRTGERSLSEIAGYPRLGTVEDLTTFARENRIDVVILSLPLNAESRLLNIAKTLRVLPIDIRLSVAATKLRFRPSTYDYVGNTPLLALSDKPISDWGMFGKTVLDKSVALIALVALAPLLAAIAVAIRYESRGPVLFRQKRYGFNNELIEIFKFRSMFVDQCDANAAKLVTKEDPRVTRIGRFIRRTSIDELPQLYNVLRGDLSLVGPRPHALQAKAADQLYDEAVEGYFARHRVKPGITGWAQINGWRGETDTTEKICKRVEHDLYYIENWSLMRDVYILLRTPLALIKSDNAY